MKFIWLECDFFIVDVSVLSSPIPLAGRSLIRLERLLLACLLSVFTSMLSLEGISIYPSMMRIVVGLWLIFVISLIYE